MLEKYLPVFCFAALLIVPPLLVVLLIEIEEANPPKKKRVKKHKYIDLRQELAKMNLPSN